MSSSTQIFGPAPRPNLSVAGQLRGEDPTGAMSAHASLDLAGPGTNIDTVVQATAAGLAGNSITITFADGSAVDEGELSVAGSAVTFAFKNGTTTVADFEAAVAALEGDDAIIEVLTPGTGASTLATTDDEFTAEALAGGTAVLARAIPVDYEHGTWGIHLLVTGTPTGEVEFAYSSLPYPDVNDDTHWVTDDTKDITLSGSAHASITTGEKTSCKVRCKVSITAGASTVCGWAMDRGV